LNKKRDALRRGIRALIADTTRDLAAFEGREPERRPPAPRGPSAEAAPGGAEDTTVAGATLPLSLPPADDRLPDADLPPPGDLRPAAMRYEVQPLNGSPISPAGNAAETAAPAGKTAPERTVPPAVPFEFITETAVFPPPVPAEGAAGSARRPASRSGKTHPAKARRPRPARAGGGTSGESPRSGGTRRARQGQASRAPVETAGQNRPSGTDDVPVDTLAPAPAESRTGVCRSYFINQECWRVANAYCNTALQVCVIRKCPVYHLHKDALEQRFAKKFKHLW